MSTKKHTVLAADNGDRPEEPRYLVTLRLNNNVLAADNGDRPEEPAETLNLDSAEMALAGENSPAADEPVIALIFMQRISPQFDDGPVAAYVHPDEVQGWLAGGWVLASRDVGVAPTEA